MEENGIHLQFDISNSELLPLKSDSRFIHLEQERVDRVDETEFLINRKDFNHLTFFHPGDLEISEATEISSNNERLSFDNPDAKNDVLSSLSSIERIADVLIQTPLETATISHDTSTQITHMINHNGSISSLSNTSFLNDTMVNASAPFINASFTHWSAEEIGAVFIVCLMVPFIILSNLFVIVSVVRFRRLHTPTNYFITSLAAVDIVVAFATPLAIVVQLFEYGGGDAAKDTILCLLPNRILMMACGMSLLILATIAYDRHTALISPLEYVNIMTSRKVGIMMFLSWIYSSAVVWLPVAAGWYDVISLSMRCSADHLHPKVHILFFVALFVPSCTVIMICYSRIFLVARHHAKQIAAVEFAVHRRLQVRFMIKDTKYAKTLALVIGAFLILWLPHLIYTFVKTFGGMSINIWLETYLVLLAVFNSGLNPWIYAFKNNEFRAAFKRMYKEYFRDKFCKNDDRRSSLVSGYSVTPRLSCTDSRMISTIMEPTADYTGHDRIRRSFDSLDEYEIQVEQTKYDRGDDEEYKIQPADISISIEDDNINNNNNKDIAVMNNNNLNISRNTKLSPNQNPKSPLQKLAGHINLAHENDEIVSSKDDIFDGRLLRKNSATSVSRNQSFTLGFHHVCSNRNYEKENYYYEQLCNCKHSSPSTNVPMVTRSSSSVSPSSLIPYTISQRVPEPIRPPPVHKLRPSSLIPSHPMSTRRVLSSSSLTNSPVIIKPQFIGVNNNKNNSKVSHLNSPFSYHRSMSAERPQQLDVSHTRRGRMSRQYSLFNPMTEHFGSSSTPSSPLQTTSSHYTFLVGGSSYDRAALNLNQIQIPFHGQYSPVTNRNNVTFDNYNNDITSGDNRDTENSTNSLNESLNTATKLRYY